MEFREELKDIRMRRGLTRVALSQELEVPLRTIEDWEMGVRTPPKYVQALIIKELRKTEEAVICPHCGKEFHV